MSYRPYGYSYPVPAPAAAVYASALTLEFLARDLGYVYVNGCWTYPNQSYGNELCTVSQQNQVTVPSLNCVGDNTTYDLQIGLPVLTSIAIVGLGPNYNLPPALLATTGVPTSQAQSDYQAAKMYLGKSFSLMNSTSVHTVIKDYRLTNFAPSANLNILTIVDTDLATSIWPVIVWGPGTVVTFKTVLLGDSVLGFLFDGITTTPVCVVQVPLTVSVTPSVFCGELIAAPTAGTAYSLAQNVACGATPLIGRVFTSTAIPYFTGPVVAGSSTNIVLPGTGGSGGYQLLGCCIPVGTKISWFTTVSAGGVGTATAVSGTSFGIALGNLIARIIVQVPRGVQVPAAGTLFTPNNNILDILAGGGAGVGQQFTSAIVINPSLSSYTLQVNYN